MELRIRLTGADLGRISMTVRPHPLWELVLSLHVLQARVAPAPYAGWRQWVLRVLTGDDTLRERVRRLTTLVPATGDFPDFLTPDGSGGFADLLRRCSPRPAPGWRGNWPVPGHLGRGRWPTVTWTRCGIWARC